MVKYNPFLISSPVGVTLISPFVGRITDWFKNAQKVDGFTAEEWARGGAFVDKNSWATRSCFHWEQFPWPSYFAFLILQGSRCALCPPYLQLLQDLWHQHHRYGCFVRGGKIPYESMSWGYWDQPRCSMSLTIAVSVTRNKLSPFPGATSSLLDPSSLNSSRWGWGEAGSWIIVMWFFSMLLLTHDRRRRELFPRFSPRRPPKLSAPTRRLSSLRARLVGLQFTRGIFVATPCYCSFFACL